MRWERAAGLVGTFVLAEVAVVAFRSDDWWPGASTGFHFTWDESRSGGQNHLLHGMMGYGLSRVGAEAWEWTCTTPETAAWLGAATGIAAVLPKELGDGLHQDFGFSVLSTLWTAAGAMLPVLQRRWSPAAAVVPKFNYWPSDEFTGRTATFPQFESDYAGMRFFLAFTPARAFRSLERWPAWLGVAVGHGVTQWVDVDPTHQWYLALDLDLRELPIRTAWWPTFAEIVNHIHLPLPGLRLEGGGVRFGLY